LGGSTGAPQSAAGAYGQLAGAATDQETAAQAAAAEIAAQGAAEDAANSSYMARGGPVSSPTSMEEALLRDRSRHEFSDPRFEELYGKYFYDDGGPVGGGIANPTDGEIARRRTFPGVTPMYTGAPRVLASPSDSSAAERGGSLGSSGDVPSSVGNPDDLMSLVYNPGNMPQVAGPVDPDIASRFGRAFPIRFMPTWGSRFLDSSAAERGGSLGSFGDVPSSVGNPDDLMSLEDQRGRLPRVTGSQGRADRSDRDPITTDAPPAVTPTPVTGPDTSFSGDSSQTVDAIKRAREAQDAYRKGLGDQSSDETGPSEAEKYFRLAAAFLAPTKTGKGAFGESVVNAAASEVKRLELETLRKTAEKNKRNDMRLKERELDYKLTHDEVVAMREIDKQRRQADLMIRLELMKTNNRLEEISPSDIKERDGLTFSVARIDEAIKDLRAALELNPNTYKGTWSDQFKMRVQEEAGLAGQVAKNTRTQSNLLSGQAVNSLKEIFGNSPTEGERAAGLSLVGIDEKTLEVREKIISKLILAAINKRNIFSNNINSINSPRTRRRSTSDE
jgi:tetratricopeptide (TPR) repeat protein